MDGCMWMLVCMYINTLIKQPFSGTTTTARFQRPKGNRLKFCRDVTDTHYRLTSVFPGALLPLHFICKASPDSWSPMVAQWCPQLACVSRLAAALSKWEWNEQSWWDCRYEENPSRNCKWHWVFRPFSFVLCSLAATSFQMFLDWIKAFFSRYTSGEVRLWDTRTWDYTAPILEPAHGPGDAGPQPHVSFVRINSSLAVAAYEDGK